MTVFSFFSNSPFPSVNQSLDRINLQKFFTSNVVITLFVKAFKGMIMIYTLYYELFPLQFYGILLSLF